MEIYRENILRGLQRAYLPVLNGYNAIFIPRGALKTALDRGVVRVYLQHLFSDLQPQELDSLVDYICPSEETLCYCGDTHCTRGRIIFASLLQLGEERIISPFHSSTDPRICDTNLLLCEETSTDENSLDPASGTIPSPIIRMPEEFDKLNPSTKDLFYHFQWQMRAPFIERLNDDYANINERAPLPWTRFRYITTEKILGQLSRLAEISIDNWHHDLLLRSHTSLSEQDNQQKFALKIFENCSEMDRIAAQKEIRLHRGAPEHDRIVQLLAAFRHRQNFHLILPWAEGGDLQDLWKKHTSPSEVPWYSAQWVLDECHGITESIGAIHLPQEVQHPGLSRSALIHTDIKPENILCFRQRTVEGNGEEASYTLKLADFGSAVHVDMNTTFTSQRVAHTKTYRPPEHDVPGNISAKYDIWCLGCLYLDFVTWAIRGWEGVQRFEENRLQRRDSRLTKAWGHLEEDTFFNKMPKRPRVTSSVMPRFVKRFEWVRSRNAPSTDTSTMELSKDFLTGFRRMGYRIDYVVKDKVQEVCDPR